MLLLRDHLVLDERLQDFIRGRAPDDCFIVARSVEISAGGVSLACNLSVIADTFEGNGATITLTPQPPVDGVDGTYGPYAYFVIRDLRSPVTIISQAQQGGIGPPAPPAEGGAPGAPVNADVRAYQYNASGFRTAKPNNRPLDVPAQALAVASGKPGEPGSAGGRGAAGGHGGSIELYYARAAPGVSEALHLSTSGGAGGQGGTGGSGGRGGAGAVISLLYHDVSLHEQIETVTAPNGADGAAGPSGPTGAAGSDGDVTVARRGERDLWAELSAVLERHLPEGATTWLWYRIRCAEYALRLPPGPDSVAEVETALHDLTVCSDYTGDDTDPRVAQLLSTYYAGSVFPGMTRLLDLVPDFEFYESTYVDYQDVINGTFQAGLQVFTEAWTFDRQRDELDRELLRAEQHHGKLLLENQAAHVGVVAADSRLLHAQQRLSEAAAALQAKEEEMKNASIDLVGALIGTVGIVASAIGAIPSGGTSLLALLPSIAQLWGTVESLNVKLLLKEARLPKGQPKPYVDKVVKDAGGVAETWNAVQGGYRAIVNLTRIKQELWTAKIDNEGFRKLLLDHVERTHEKLLADLHVGQAKLTAEAADVGVAIGAAGLDELRRRRAQVEVQSATAAEIGFALLRSAQRQIDILARNAFLALRALEVYTDVDLSESVRFDYGHVHPDMEQDGIDGLLPINDVVNALRLSWSQYPDLVNLRDRYVQHFASRDFVRDTLRVTISDAETVDSFKVERRARLLLRLDDLPSRRYEAKAVGVRVALIGASAAGGAMSVVVTHSGVWQSALRDGSVAEQTLEPRSAVVSASLEPLTTDGGPATPDGKTGFWGRGVASSWTIEVEPDEVSLSSADFGGLVAIQVWLTYESFRVPGTLRSVLRRGNAALRALLPARFAADAETQRHLPVLRDGFVVARSPRRPSSFLGPLGRRHIASSWRKLWN